MVESNPYSFEGYSFIEWLKGNWKTIKEIIKLGAPLLLGLALFQDNPALIALITAVGKLIIDGFEYWIKE